ncbi:cytochrome c oxidase subunit ApiCOX18, putative [Hepatocystis sp. ex Piliocolobus tephrosceles]|nr:cytochrome c oxidase subunit ApiCOX18, putative [Hepatocystis sp. ex Piliocolobus tephrosceles]
MKIAKLRNIQQSCMQIPKCFFSVYTGKHVSDSDLVKKKDDWYIEETNFCLGRVTKLRFSEKDDMARRVLKIMDSQLSKMYTRMRDGTVIPFMSFYLNDVIDKPAPNHQFIEQPLIKWTWDEAYDEAYEEK